MKNKHHEKLSELSIAGSEPSTRTSYKTFSVGKDEEITITADGKRIHLQESSKQFR